MPEDGEIVIEECLDGTRRCKVGDGHSRFSKLSYVDEATQTRLLNELDTLRQTFSSQIKSTHESLSEQIKSTKQELSEAIQQTAEDLALNYKENDNKVTTELNEALTELSSNLTPGISRGRKPLSPVQPIAEKNT